MKQVLAPALVGQNLDMSADFTVDLPNMLQEDIMSVQANYTGSPVGNLYLEGSLDKVNYAAIPVNVSGSQVLVLSLPGSTSPILLDISTAIPYLRLRYEATSGTGSMSVLASNKRLGD